MAVTITWALQGIPEPRAIDLEASVARLRELVTQSIGNADAEVTLLLAPALIASGPNAPATFDPQGQIHRIWQSGNWVVPAAAQQPEQPASPEE